MRETFITVILLILIAVGGWAWFKYAEQPPTAGPTPNELKEESEQLRQYRLINDLKPDTGVFSDPIFKSLQSFHAVNATSTIPKGRPNPFNPF